MLTRAFLMIFTILLFVYSFFPISYNNPNINQDPKNFDEKLINYRNNPKYKKLILIVIDALRLDYVTSEYMPKLTETVTTGKGCFIKLSVKAPTVTLPRIKSLISGSVPQFLDIIINLSNPHKLQDSLLHSARNRDKKIVFYGDDTWLKLFPTTFFQRTEGTSSFFVHDFDEVDHNVTRNVNLELKKRDWDIMVLHYLGLDHIGHVLGSEGWAIKRKLKEMDEIINKIHESIKDDSTLIVVTGDHGMKDGGGHGGSTHPETNTPLIVSRHSCLNDTFSQSDVAVNLAVLLGLEIPSTSIGLIHKSLLNHLHLEDYLNVLAYNNLLLLRKIDTNLCRDNFINAGYYHQLFLNNENKSNNGYEAARLYNQCSKLISEKLVNWSSTTQSDIGILAITNTLYFLTTIFFSNRSLERLLVILILSLHCLLILNDIIVALIHLAFMVLIGKNLIELFEMIQIKRDFQFDLKFIILLTFLHPLTFFSSSFIEEEHQFWYFSTTTFLILTAIAQKNYLQGLIVLIFLRFSRIINQTGDKWAFVSDLSDWFLIQQNYVYLQLFFIINLLIICYYSYKYLLETRTKIVTYFSIIFLISLFKINLFQDNILLGKFIWLLIIIEGLFLNNCLTTWILVLLLLLKPFNIFLLLTNIIASQFLCKSYKRNDYILVISHLLLGEMLFFAQGHSNSLSSVDVSIGYVGLYSYQPFIVFAQVLIHTYSFPVLSFLLLIKNSGVDRKQLFELLLIQRGYVISIIFYVLLQFRYHLFILSVFAPKLLIESVHCSVLFVIILIYYLFNLFSNVLNKFSCKGI